MLPHPKTKIVSTITKNLYFAPTFDYDRWDEKKIDYVILQILMEGGKCQILIICRCNEFILVI